MQKISNVETLRPSNAVYGSDLMVEVLRELGIRYIALNPGASYRGLHDSLVNFGPGKTPEMILCTHEEIAVALANGYAKATGKLPAESGAGAVKQPFTPANLSDLARTAKVDATGHCEARGLNDRHCVIERARHIGEAPVG